MERGKTTTIKMITGILNPDQGDIFIDGKIQKEPLEPKKILDLCQMVQICF